MVDTQTYHALAQSRPRIRRDVLYTQTPEGVLFHNAQTGFHLKSASAYRFSSLIVPHLNGERQVSDICEGFSEGNRALVAELVKSLYQRGFARNVPATVTPPTVSGPVAQRFAPQIAYIDHHVDGAERRFAQFRSTRVAILGTDLIARWCAMSLVRNGSAAVGVLRDLDARRTDFDSVRAEATALTDNGCGVDIATLTAAPGAARWRDLDDYDVIVVTPSSDGPAQLLALLTDGVPPGRILLPAWRFGDSAVIGPMTQADRPGCWMCAALRLAANGDSGDAADLWRSIAVPPQGSGPQNAPSRPLAAMIGNLLGYEIFRIATGALPAETDRRVIVQDLASLDVVAEPLLPHPRCQFCTGQPAQQDSAALSIRDRSASLDDAAEHSQELAAALLTELDRLSILVQPHTGPIRRFTDEPLTQTPLKVGTVEIAVGHAVRREIAAFDVHTVVGARMRAVHTAAAVYAEHVAPDPAVVDSVEADLLHGASRRVRPAELDITSGLIVGVDDIEHWTPATSLLTDDGVLVPAAAVRPFGTHNQERLFVRTSAGTGAGASLADAAARGLLSALGYRALLGAIRGQVGVQAVALDSLDADAELKFLVRSAGNLKLDTELLDIGPAKGTSAFVVLARAVNPATNRWVWSISSRPQWRAAAISALRDLVGLVQLGVDPDRTGDEGDTGDQLLSDLEPGALAVYGERPAAIGAAVSWQDITADLRRTGTDALVVPTTSADLAQAGLHTVRVLLASGERHVG